LSGYEDRLGAYLCILLGIQKNPPEVY